MECFFQGINASALFPMDLIQDAITQWVMEEKEREGEAILFLFWEKSERESLFWEKIWILWLGTYIPNNLSDFLREIRTNV